MATYILNQATGIDSNVGSVGAPWKNVEYALSQMTDGDILEIVAPATAPLRHGLIVTKGGTATPLTVKGYGDDYAHILGTIDVSHGASIGNRLLWGDMEGWSAANTLAYNRHNGWCTTQNISKESTIVHGGLYSVKFYRFNATNREIAARTYLPKSTSIKVRFWHRGIEAGAVGFQFLVKRKDDDTYLQNDLTSWGAANWIATAVGTTTWQQHIITWTTPAVSTYYDIYLSLKDANGTLYLDDLEIIDAAETYSWSVHDGATYILDNYLIVTPNRFAKCLNTAWTASGVETLECVTKADDLADCIATENTWWAETGQLYYHKSASETIANMHFECSTRTDNASPLYEGVKTLATADKVNLTQIKSYFAHESGINIKGDDSQLTNSESYYAGLINILFSVVTGITTSDILSYGSGDDGIYFETVGVVNGTRLVSTLSGDDGIQIASTAANVDITLSLVKSYENGTLERADNSGICIECNHDDSVVRLYKSVFYGNYGWGVSVGTTDGNPGGGTVTVRNVAAEDNGTDFFQHNAFDGTFDHQNNCYVSSGGVNFVVHATDVVASPEFVDAANGDFRLLPTSPCRDAGVVIAGLTTDFEDKPVPMGSAPDIGAYEFPVPSPMGMTPGLGMGGRMIPSRRRRR